MSDQIREACELRVHAERLADQDIGEWQGPTGDCADMRAGIVLARAYLAEHDPTPITEEWLRSVGFEQIEGAMDRHTQLGILRTNPEFTNREGDRRWFLQENGGHPVTIPRQLKPKSRGQLCRLASDLGITLKETV